MKIKGIVDIDIVNYKKPSLYIAMPYCTFKCNKDCGEQVCQNQALADEKLIDISPENILSGYYYPSSITSAIVFGGLEPFDSFPEILDFIKVFRKESQDDIVIYTGYNENEIFDKVKQLKKIPNIIIKYGRFLPNHSPIYDEVLGVKLASKNQYAVKIS